ncbi:hypothetical protein B0H12DRAFT_316935 [Mycena haematopus]|nr:hypothetical protein B0H12DRAFT_316935 [Mycena haematopus]
MRCSGRHKRTWRDECGGRAISLVRPGMYSCGRPQPRALRPGAPPAQKKSGAYAGSRSIVKLLYDPGTLSSPAADFASALHVDTFAPRMHARVADDCALIARLARFPQALQMKPQRARQAGRQPVPETYEIGATEAPSFTSTSTCRSQEAPEAGAQPRGAHCTTSGRTRPRLRPTPSLPSPSKRALRGWKSSGRSHSPTSTCARSRRSGRRPHECGLSCGEGSYMRIQESRQRQRRDEAWVREAGRGGGAV